MNWKTSWSYAQRRTTFTRWVNQRSFSYTIYNNLYGVAMRLKFSNWYGSKNCKIFCVKVVLNDREYMLKKDEKTYFSVSNQRDECSDILVVKVKPGEIKITVEFASEERPESGNTFPNGISMILQSLEVQCNFGNPSIAALFGDSIIHRRKWSDPLIERMYGRYPGKISIFDMSIDGSRLLNDSPKEADQTLGYKGVSRLRHDLLRLSGISHLVFALGLNDLSMPTESAEMKLTFESYVSCVEKIIEEVHGIGIKIIGLTICPRMINNTYTKEKNELRIQLNHWIMNIAGFDYREDVARLVANVDDLELAVEYDCGDGIHLNDKAGKKIANAFQDEIFF